MTTSRLTAAPDSVVVVLTSPTKTVRAHVRGLVQRLLAGGRRRAPGRSRAPCVATFSDLLDVDEVGIVLPLGHELRPAHDLAAATTLRHALRARPAQVVHAHGFRAGAVSALAVRLVRPRPALVTTWHALPYAGPSGRVAIGAGARMVARSSDVTLAPSADVLARSVEVGASRARLSPVAAPRLPGPRRDREQLRAALAAELGLRADVPWILAVGRIVPEKDHDLLLDAAARWLGLHPTPEVLVVGVGAAPAVARLRRTIAEGRLPVRLLGARDDIGELMHAADVYVLTSRWEAPALSVQEAMQAGLPVVATAVGGVPDLLGDTGVLVAAGRPGGLRAGGGPPAQRPGARGPAGRGRRRCGPGPCPTRTTWRATWSPPTPRPAPPVPPADARRRRRRPGRADPRQRRSRPGAGAPADSVELRGGARGHAAGVRHRRRRLLPGEGADGLEPRPAAPGPRSARGHAEAGPVPQRGPRAP